MRTYYFERTTVDYFHVDADSEQEARLRVRTEPSRYQEGRHDENWTQTDKDGHWEDDL